MVLSLSPGDFTARTNIDIYRHASMLRITGDVWDRANDLTKCLERWEMWQELSSPECRIDLDMIPFGALQVYTDQAGTHEQLSGFGSRRLSMFTPEQKRSFITMHALAASPLLMGGELTMTPDDDIALITNPHILECNRNGVTGKKIFYSNYLDVRQTPRHNMPEHGWLGIFNRFDTVKEMVMTAAMLGLRENRYATLKSLWDDRIVDFLENRLRVEIQPNDVLFLQY
jgi:hypothetical protein